jgi:DNA-directed RNA polymerase beta subunit
MQNTKIYQVDIPYAAKQLLQELMAMHIVPKLYFAPKKNYI